MSLLHSRMHIVVPSAKRPNTLTTHKWLDASGMDYSIAVHNEEEFQAYARNPSVNADRLRNMHVSFGTVPIRQACLDVFGPHTDWVVMLDDDFTNVYRVEEPFYSYDHLTFAKKYDGEWQRKFNQPCDARTFFSLLENDMRWAENHGIYLCGVSPITNYYFRAAHYKTVAFVEGRVMAVLRSHLRFDTACPQIEDWGFTAQNLLEFGRVLVNQYLNPQEKNYQPGGLGTYDERVEARLADAKYLVEKYPGLFRYKQAAGKPANQDVALRIHDEQKLAEWRAGMGVR